MCESAPWSLVAACIGGMHRQQCDLFLSLIPCQGFIALSETRLNRQYGRIHESQCSCCCRVSPPTVAYSEALMALSGNSMLGTLCKVRLSVNCIVGRPEDKARFDVRKSLLLRSLSINLLLCCHTAHEAYS